MSEEVGARIRGARRKAGLTQAGLAARLGMVRSAVTNYERGINDPGTETLSRIAEACGVSTDWLLGVGDRPRSHAEGSTPPSRTAHRNRYSLLDALRNDRGTLRVLQWRRHRGGAEEDSGGDEVALSDVLGHVQPGDWEGLARALTVTLSRHEETERIRAKAELAAREAERFAREADLIAHRTVEATVSRLLSGLNPIAPANAERARVPASPVSDEKGSRVPSPGGLPRPD